MGALRTLEELRNHCPKGYSAENNAIFKQNGIEYAVMDVTVVEEKLTVFFDIATANEVDSVDIPTWGKIQRELMGIDDGYFAHDDLGVIDKLEGRLWKH